MTRLGGALPPLELSEEFKDLCRLVTLEVCFRVLEVCLQLFPLHPLAQMKGGLEEVVVQLQVELDHFVSADCTEHEVACMIILRRNASGIGVMGTRSLKLYAPRRGPWRAFLVWIDALGVVAVFRATLQLFLRRCFEVGGMASILAVF